MYNVHSKFIVIIPRSFHLVYSHFRFYCYRSGHRQYYLCHFYSDRSLWWCCCCCCGCCCSCCGCCCFLIDLLLVILLPVLLLWPKVEPVVLVTWFWAQYVPFARYLQLHCYHHRFRVDTMIHYRNFSNHVSVCANDSDYLKSMKIGRKLSINHIRWRWLHSSAHEAQSIELYFCFFSLPIDIIIYSDIHSKDFKMWILNPAHTE